MNIYEACVLSCEKWVDSFPDDIPKHNFSKEHNNKMSRLTGIYSLSSNPKLIKKAVQIIIVAAIILSLCITALAMPASREFIVKKFSINSTYSVVDVHKPKKVKSLTVNYIPEGFELVDEYIDKYGYIIYQEYEKEQKYFIIKKCRIDLNIDYDTEFHDCKTISINNLDAIYFKPDNNMSGIILNNSNYTFVVTGNIDKDELVKIVQKAE